MREAESLPPPFAPSVPSSWWAEIYEESLRSGQCQMTTVRVPVHRGGPTDPTPDGHFAFEALDCGNAEGWGFSSTTKVYAHFGEVYVDASDQLRTEYDRRVAEYWFLPPGQTAEQFMGGIVAGLPHEDQRYGCIVEEDKDFAPRGARLGRFLHIRYSDKFYEEMARVNPGDMLAGYCGRYGPTNGGRRFLDLGEILVFLEFGQAPRDFDQTSFRYEPLAR